jgi:hypothetical protein
LVAVSCFFPGRAKDLLTPLIKKNAEALVVASKENGLEVNVDKIKYIVAFRDQNAGRSHNIKIDYSFFARAEEFKYLGKKLNKSKLHLGRNL